MDKIVVSCPGSCGELIQGYIDNELKLVSCGIESYSYATIKRETLTNQQAGDKAKDALNLTEKYLGITEENQLELDLDIRSNLPVAKGMASSTADIAAASLATSLAYKKPLQFKDIAKICTQIESTDSVMFDSMTLFASKSGDFVEETNWQPEFYVLVLEPETLIKTAAFHTQKNDKLFKQQAKSFSRVHALYLTAVKEKSLDKLGEAATKSAILNQVILPKPFFKEVVSIQSNYQSVLGINVAHSGTVIGILLRDLTEKNQIINELEKEKITAIYNNINVYRSCFEGLKEQKG